MAAWEYLHLFMKSEWSREGGLKALRDSRNMQVTSSDGRWENTKLPAAPMEIMAQLGAEGWEIVSIDGSPDAVSLWAWFKRQR